MDSSSPAERRRRQRFGQRFHRGSDGAAPTRREVAQRARSASSSTRVFEGARRSRCGDRDRGCAPTLRSARRPWRADDRLRGCRAAPPSTCGVEGRRAGAARTRDGHLGRRRCLRMPGRWARVARRGDHGQDDSSLGAVQGSLVAPRRSRIDGAVERSSARGRGRRHEDVGSLRAPRRRRGRCDHQGIVVGIARARRPRSQRGCKVFGTAPYGLGGACSSRGRQQARDGAQNSAAIGEEAMTRPADEHWQ
jgi:hypothetical protein